MSSALIERIRSEVGPISLRRDPQLRRVMRRISTEQQLSPQDWQAVGADYVLFSRAFPKILQSLLQRPDFEKANPARPWIEKIHAEEVGSDSPNAVPHVRLFESFLESVGVDLSSLEERPPSNEARQLVDSLESLYSGHNGSALATALGGQTAFEILGEEIIRNFTWVAANGTACDLADLRYFDIHLIAEAEHVRSMEQVVAHYESERSTADNLLDGARQVSNLMKAFWTQLWKPVFDPTSNGYSVFLSWSGKAAQQSAEELRRVFDEKVGPDELRSFFFHSDRDISSGKNWEQSIMDAAAAAETAVIVLTPESAQSAWVNYEAGLLNRSTAVAMASGHPPIHVLVVSENPEALVEGHPLQNLQYATSGDIPRLRSLVHSLWKLIADRYATVAQPTHDDVKALTKKLRDRLRPLEFEAERALARADSFRADWTEYILSLAGARFDVGPPRGTNRRLPHDIRSWDDVVDVVDGLIDQNFGLQLGVQDRVYFAVRMDKEGEVRGRLEEKVDLKPDQDFYRVTFVSAGSLDQRAWQRNLLVGPKSTIGRAATSSKPEWSHRDDPKNARIEDEILVGCVRVRLGEVSIGVLGISTADKYRNSRPLESRLTAFAQSLEFLFAIVASRLTRGDLDTESDVIDRDGNDPYDSAAEAIRHALASHNLQEVFTGNRLADRLINAESFQ